MKTIGDIYETLSYRTTGYGHFRISIERGGKILSKTTTNSLAIMPHLTSITMMRTTMGGTIRQEGGRRRKN